MINILCILFNFHTNAAYRSNEIGNEYFHTFAQYLQKEFMDKPADKIFALIDQVMKVCYVLVQSCC